MSADNYNSSFTGQQIDEAVSKVQHADKIPVKGSHNLIESGAVEAALGDVASVLQKVVGEIE